MTAVGHPRIRSRRSSRLSVAQQSPLVSAAQNAIVFTHPAVRVFRIRRFERFLIFYRPARECIEILRVLHSSGPELALCERRSHGLVVAIRVCKPANSSVTGPVTFLVGLVTSPTLSAPYSAGVHSHSCHRRGVIGFGLPRRSRFCGHSSLSLLEWFDTWALF